MNSCRSSDPSTTYIEETTLAFTNILLELSLNFTSLDFQIKISRLIVELSKFRIRNYSRIISLENFPEVKSELLLNTFFKFCFKNGRFLPQDDKGVAQGYIFSDFEKDSADLSVVAITSLRLLIKKLSPKSKVLAGMKIVDILTRLKAMQVSFQSQTFLFTVDEKKIKYDMD